MNSHLNFEANLLSRPSRLSPQACPQCAGDVSIDSPHLRITKGSIQVFCMEMCLRDFTSPKPAEAPREAPETRGATSGSRTLFLLGLGVAALSPCAAQGLAPAEVEPAGAGMLTLSDEVAQADVTYGPPLPTEQELADEAAEAADEAADEFAASLGTVKWVHPLRGPGRRMPLRQSRAFGAARPGHRPYECRSGHCGVDLGGQHWGEPVLASSDAIVDRVSRSRYRSGGLYVRLSHLDGTVFTQYFHLAAIPKRLHKGQELRAGDTIGLLGETGVENSGPHLHFTVSVKADAEGSELYIDPEPLIALWPMRHSGQAHAMASGPPGVPIGATGRYKGRRKRHRIGKLGSTRAGTMGNAPDLMGLSEAAGPASAMPAL